MLNSWTIRKIEENDQEWIKKTVETEWGVPIITPSGQHDVTKEDGFVALDNNAYAGFLTYEIKNNECEITALLSLIQYKGVGTSLLETVKNEAKKYECKRLWVVTTNDNINGLKFYQKKGFHFAKIYVNEVEKYQKIKSIPETGCFNIPIRDVIELEINLY